MTKVDGTESAPITVRGAPGTDRDDVVLRGNDDDDWRVFHIRHDFYILEVSADARFTKNGRATIRVLVACLLRRSSDHFRGPLLRQIVYPSETPGLYNTVMPYHDTTDCMVKYTAMCYVFSCHFKRTVSSVSMMVSISDKLWHYR